MIGSVSGADAPVHGAPMRWSPAAKLPARLLFIALAALLLVACPKSRKTLVPAIPTTGDATARDRFQEARARFERDGSGGEDFAAIARDYPADPIAPFAKLYAGMSAVKRDDHDAAVVSLQELVDRATEVDEGLVRRSELYLGIARTYRGEHSRALPLLARSERAIENDDERNLWTAAMAVTTASSQDPLAALPWYDRWWKVARPPEKGYILRRLDEIIEGAPADRLRPAYGDLDKGGPSAAVLGWRIAGELDATARPDDARAVRSEIADARRGLGLDVGEVKAPEGERDGSRAGLVAAALPLDGKQGRVGEAVLRGLALGAGALGGPPAVTALVEDAATAAGATAAVDSAVLQQAVAVIGPIDSEAVDAAAVRAGERRIPLLTLSPRADERRTGEWVFHVMHSAEARARALARRAHAAGARRVAILAPDSGYGRAVGAAFKAEMVRLGGTIALEVTYAADTKSFAATAKQLTGSWQALFVPEQADRLELIAPALAAGGLVPRPFGARKVTSGRPIVLLSTAEGAGPDYVRDAGRHSLGALLAPGFLVDRGDPVIGPFVSRFEQGFGRPPSAVDAYAYDAALAVARIQAPSRAELAKKLASGSVEGVTGSMRFDREHRRADDGVIFTIEDDGAGGVKVRALR
jgi:branched-chain amino acid transport system substrate-binding protein